MTSTGTETVRLDLGGRYLASTFKSKSDQFGPFQGRAILAYDRLEKEFVQTWIDTMGTGIMVSKGKLLDDGKTLELVSKIMDPMTMQRVSPKEGDFGGELDVCINVAWRCVGRPVRTLVRE